MHICHESNKTVTGPISARIVALYHQNRQYTEAKTNKETTQVKNPLKKEQTQPIELQKEGIKQKKGKTTKSNGIRLLSNITNLEIEISKKK